jgi:cytochrome c
MRAIHNVFEGDTVISRKTLSAGVAVVALAVLGGLAPGVGATADAAGQSAFVQCAACHSTDGSNGVGPSLKGIVGRSSASVSGFAYSNAMKRAQLQWTAEQLDKYIASPQTVVPGNVMPYAGMADATRRADLVAYLATLK